MKAIEINFALGFNLENPGLPKTFSLRYMVHLPDFQIQGLKKLLDKLWLARTSKCQKPQFLLAPFCFLFILGLSNPAENFCDDSVET